MKKIREKVGVVRITTTSIYMITTKNLKLKIDPLFKFLINLLKQT